MNKKRFYILVLAVAVAGVSQGLTLPLLSIMIEKAGYPSSLNGWNATALYIGMFISSFFVAKPLRRFGYKPLLLFGIIVVFLSSLLIPFWHHLTWWFILRFMIGVGDSALHYASQLWITSSSSPRERGRQISLYGLAYGAGFMLGPLGVNLWFIHDFLPFIVVSILYIIAFLFVMKLENQYPEQSEKKGDRNSLSKVIYLGWYALIPAFLYGYLEAVLNGSFPVYALRTGIGGNWVSIILFAFSAGAILTQLPLGILSDRVGRKKVLMVTGIIGAIAFFLVPAAGNQVWMVIALFILSGCVVGSFFSLGLAYVADTLPRHLLPSGNVVAAILFSIGSMMGPSLTGMGIQFIDPSSLFYSLSAVFATYFLLGFRRQKLAGHTGSRIVRRDENYDHTGEGSS